MKLYVSFRIVSRYKTKNTGFPDLDSFALYPASLVPRAQAQPCLKTGCKLLLFTLNSKKKKKKKDKKKKKKKDKKKKQYVDQVIDHAGVGRGSIGETRESLVQQEHFTNTTTCDRKCMTTMMTEVLESMMANDPFRLPLSEVYKATENSHPAALNMMTLWRTVTKAGPPDLLAIDTKQGQAYFSLDITEGNGTAQSILWGRIKVVDQLLTEFELFVNRGRGEDGFAYDAENLPHNYKRWMTPPKDRVKASRAELNGVAAASFNSNDNTTINMASDCQFTEMGWIVKNAACNWMPDRPTDLNARTVVLDEELGIIVTAGVVPGKVYPYATFSAFIPDSMESSQKTQDTWYAIQKSEGYIYLVEPTEALGTSFNVFQYYNNELQGEQFLVYLSGPRNGTAWA